MNVTHTEPTPSTERATEFTATYDTGEHYDGYTLMVEAYALLWVILMAWLVLVWRKQVSLSARVDGLESAIARAANKKAAEKPEPSR